MADDTEFIKLPLLQRCTHKLWKARVHGYTEAAKLFQEEDEKSAVFGQYLGLVHNFVSDSNAAAQEKGLEATLYFVENAAVAGKTVKDVMSAIIAKSIAAPKKNTQELSLKITLMYIEIEKQEAVVEELVKGLEHKNPKIIIACLTTLTTCLKEFGSQVVGIKPLIKPVQNLIEDRDKTVREDTKALLIEIFRWIGDAIKPLLTKLKPVQLTDLETEFAKIRGSKARPTRYLRSQQAKAEKKSVIIGDADDENDGSVEEEEVIDPLSLIEPINILSKIPNDFYEKIEAKKWQDRKEALEGLDKILDYPKFEKGDYGELVRALLKIINKDSNVVVVGIATKCVARLALGLNKNFHPYASATLAPLLAKFKEKKANVVTPLREAVDAIFPSTSLDAIVDDVVASLDSKNPSIKAETAGFIGRCFAQSNPTELNKKLLKPYVSALLKSLNEPDPTVRDNSAEALGTAMKLVSEKIIMPFFGDIDPLKLSKIKECCEKSVVKFVAIKKKPEPVKKSKPLKPETKQIQFEETPIEDEICEEDNKKSTDKIDITTKLTNKLIDELSDKNWKTRYDALISIQTILIDTKIRPNLGELPALLVQRFEDSNSKIIATAFEVCGHLAAALGPSSKNYVQTFIRGILNALGDSKQPVRNAAMNCLKTWANEAGAKELFYGEVFPDILKTTSSNVLKNEVWTWLGELLPAAKALPKDELCLLIPCLFSALEDRSADVRKAGNNAVYGLMMQVGYQNMIKDAEKLKPVSKPGILQILDKVRPDVPEIEAPCKPNNETKGKMPPPKAAPNNTKKVRNSICPPAAKPKPKKDEEGDVNPLLMVNKLKNQRVLDEQKLKILKWNFTTPRQEFVDLLKDQMVLAGFNKNLIVNMFHIDFKFHIKAIESLIDDLYNQDALISNLDLILKWMTLRFFDTNPSVLLKGLEYLQSAFSILIDKEYNMFDLEANSFVPYLIMKIGDPKDTVRDRVRTILRQFSLMIPPGKLFLHVMDGLKSKNSRLRSESLDELGYLIEQFGTSVCLPSVAVALKEISKQIADRNNAVRSAALNTIVKAYFVDGDKIYKQIGKLSDKDMCYLEERIKRTSQNRTKMLHDLTNVTTQPSDSVKAKKPEPEIEKIEEAEEENEPNIVKGLTPKTSPIIEKEPSPKHEFPNPYKEYWNIKNPVIDLSKFDNDIDESFLYEPIYIPENIYSKLKYNTPPNQALEELFRNIASDNIEISINDLKKLQGVFESDLAHNLDNYSKGIFDSLISQLQKANNYDFNNQGILLGQLYKMIFKNIDTIYKNKSILAKRAEKSHIQDLIHQLLIALVEEKTKLFDGNDLNQWIMIFIANIIENSNTTEVTCALIDSLRDLIVNLPKNASLINFYMKCILKVVIIIKNANNLDEILNLDDVLYTCHLFIDALPRNAWQNYPNNIPFKAFNTLIVNLVQIKRIKILTHLKNIENPNASEFVMYLKKIVKQVTNMKKSIKLSENISNNLAEIFKIIAEENSKEGLEKLYEFKKNNPDVRLSTILSSTSLGFQQYISDGLKNIEQERGTTLEITHSVENSFANFELEELPSDPADQPLYYFYKLKMYQRRLGYPESNLSDFLILRREP